MDAGFPLEVFPRQPLQQRSKDRFEQVLDAARELLLESGLAGFSIPELAVRLNFSRATIYNFFPAPHSIFNELTRRYLAQLEALLMAEGRKMGEKSWHDATRFIAELSAVFFNSHPVARLLILGGPTTDESHRALELMVQRLGSMVRRMFEARGVTLPPAPPDVSLLVVEIGFSCARASFFLHGEITPQYRDEAAKAMIAYFSPYVPQDQRADLAQNKP